MADSNAEKKSGQGSTNRLFIIFSSLSFLVAIINIHFHHLVHVEHVHDKSRRQFIERFETSRWDGARGKRSRTPQAPGGGDGMHKLAGLRCMEEYGGPEDSYAESEMAFWSDIPSDASYKSPFMDDDNERFLTFEPDHGGWNNIRMAMETALVMAHAMGRTLVLPPEQRFYLLNKQSSEEHKNEFDFGDFFHLDSIAVEHDGFNVISSEEFLHRLGTTGKLINVDTGKPEIWNEGVPHTASNVRSYLLKVGVNPHWSPIKCAAAFPSSRGEHAIEELRRAHEYMMSKNRSKLEEFVGNPVPVDASVGERMREMLADRDELCIYDERLQNAHVVHFPAQKDTRLLTHFYAFVFFADWRADLWSKRFVRDHLRYIDEIMCAAARVVEAVRERSKNKNRQFDSMHVRRGGECSSANSASDRFALLFFFFVFGIDNFHPFMP
jgi:hypothetical protein